MLEAKSTQRALVRIGYDGRVHKQFLGPKADERFENECRVLRYLETRRCPFVPRLLSADPKNLEIVTSNCGSRVEHLSETRVEALFAELETYGVRHDDAFLRNVTYRASDGRFCIIDFEFSTILENNNACTVMTLGKEIVSLGEAIKPRNIAWSAMTHPGNFRSNNEDRFLLMLADKRGVRYLGKNGSASSSEGDLIFAVADGMGGERSGELAGKIAIEQITRMMPTTYLLNDEHLIEASPGILKTLFQSIHTELERLGSYDIACTNMGSTLTLVWIHRSVAMFAHIGDTRLYRIRRSDEDATVGRSSGYQLSQISEDHTFVGWLRRTGQINERQARFHPRKNVLSKALGAGHQFVEPHCGTFELHAGDRLILCSDGVIEGLWDHALTDLVLFPDSVQASQPPAQRLVLSAVSESGRDNATAIVLEVN
ncbi:MAG: serine/threonine-protein phosphatase [Planctomycetes bacterium]|nr:serine/threonine-protein phosphatase [Planctomycetota bacterium]